MNVTYIMRKADSDLTETGPSSEKEETKFIKLLDAISAGTIHSEIDIEVGPNKNARLKWVTDQGYSKGLRWTSANYTWNFYVHKGEVNLNIVEVILRRISKDGKSIKSYKASGDLIYSLTNQRVQRGTITWNDDTQNPEGREPDDRLEIIFIIRNTATSSSTVIIGSDSQYNLLEEKEEIQREQEGLSKLDAYALSSLEASFQDLTESFSQKRKLSTKSSWLWPWFRLSIGISFVAFMVTYVVAMNYLPISGSDPGQSFFENITRTSSSGQDSSGFNDKFRTALILAITAAIIPIIIFAVANNIKVQEQNNELSSISLKIRETRSRIMLLRQKQALNLRIQEQRRKETASIKAELRNRVEELKSKIEKLEGLENRIEEIEYKERVKTLEKLEARVEELEKSPQSIKEGEAKEGSSPTPSGSAPKELEKSQSVKEGEAKEDASKTSRPTSEKSQPSPSDSDIGEQIKGVKVSSSATPFDAEGFIEGNKRWLSKIDPGYHWIEISLGDTPQMVYGIGIKWGNLVRGEEKFIIKTEDKKEVRRSVVGDGHKNGNRIVSYFFSKGVKAKSLKILVEAPQVAIYKIEVFFKPRTATATTSETDDRGTEQQSKSEGKEDKDG